MKKTMILLFLAVVCCETITAQSAWTHRSSETAARNLIKKSEFVTSTHAIYEKDVRISYQWDSKEDRPIVVEEGIVSVVALIGGIRYSGIFFQSDNAKIKSVEAYYKSGKTYSVPLYTRTYEDQNIFSQDGEYVGFALGGNALFGEIVKYKYVKVYNDIKFFTNTFFQDYNYVEKGKLEIWVPKWCDVDILPYHLKGRSFKKSKDQRVDWKKKKGDLFDPLSTTSTYTVHSYGFEKLLPYKSEPNSPGGSHYRPHLLYVNKSYNYNSDYGRLIKQPGDLYKWYKSLVDELEDEPSDEIKQIADSLVQSSATDLDKMKSIFYWVQDHIRYIAFEDGIAGFKPEEAKYVCQDRYGDCKGMANLTKSMLVYLGFDARLTWIGTRHIAYTYEQPTLAADNHMICTVILDDGTKMFLDPTEDYVSIKDNAYRIQGQQAMIENGDSFILEVIPELTPEQNKVHIRKVLSMESGNLSGTEERRYYGESKKTILASYAGLKNQNKENALNRFLGANNKNLSIRSVNASDFDNREGSLEIDFKFNLKNNVIELDNRKMIQLDWDQEFYFLDFDKSRLAPYEFRSKQYRITDVSLTVPNGYKVAQMPAEVLIEREGYTFKVGYQQSQNKVIMHKELILSSTMIQPSQFKQWNEDIAVLRAAYDKNLIITKD